MVQASFESPDILDIASDDLLVTNEPLGVTLDILDGGVDDTDERVETALAVNPPDSSTDSLSLLTDDKPDKHPTKYAEPATRETIVMLNPPLSVIKDRPPKARKSKRITNSDSTQNLTEGGEPYLPIDPAARLCAILVRDYILGVTKEIDFDELLSDHRPIYLGARMAIRDRRYLLDEKAPSRIAEITATLDKDERKS